MHDMRHTVQQDVDRKQPRYWWFGEITAQRLQRCLQRSVFWIERQDDALLAVYAGLAPGDVVVVAAEDAASPSFCEIDGPALVRHVPDGDMMVRSVRWYPGDASPSAWRDTLAGLMPGVEMSPSRFDWLASRKAATDADRTPDDAVHDAVRIVRRPAPLIPTLYASHFGAEIVHDFRWREYLAAYPDIAANCPDEASAFAHFFNQGYYERRLFDPKRVEGLDPGYYRQRYPELGLGSDAEAQLHYCYIGYYEQRVPNATTAWLHDAGLHVYQMGKVGSHSIAAALEGAGYSEGVVHLHWPTDPLFGYPANRIPYPAILSRPRERPVKVISATREIVSWTVSGLFQSYGSILCNARDAIGLIEEDFWSKCVHGLEWFGHRYYCGLDVYRHPFDHDAGCTRIAHAPLDLLIYRQEDMNRLESEFADFLDLPDFRLARHNDGEDKRYSALYRDIVAQFRLPGALLDELYDTPFMRHFYSDAERERFRARWLRPG